MSWRPFFAAAAAAAALGAPLGGLSGCAAPPAQSAVDDDVCPDSTPPPSDRCLEGQCGNELGVGRPCTRGGGQCDVFSLVAGEAGICILYFADNTNVHCCSKPCSVDDDCGDGAVCAENPANPASFGCVPAGCEGR